MAERSCGKQGMFCEYNFGLTYENLIRKGTGDTMRERLSDETTPQAFSAVSYKTPINKSQKQQIIHKSRRLTITHLIPIVCNFLSLFL